MDDEHLRRRMEKRRNAKPKGLFNVLQALGTSQFAPRKAEHVRETPMKARSTRFRGRTLVVGRTLFVFDHDGICMHQPKGNSLADFKVLLKYPGVEAVDELKDPDEDVTMPIAPDPTLLNKAARPTVPVPTPAPPAPEPEAPDLEQPPPDSHDDDVVAEAASGPEAVTAIDMDSVSVPEPIADDEESPEPAPASDAPAQPKQGRRRRSSKVQEG